METSNINIIDVTRMMEETRKDSVFTILFSVFIFIAQRYAERGYATVRRLSVYPSVGDVQVYCDHIGWNNSKIISRLISLR